MSSIIKVNTYQDANGNALFSSDGSGNVTLSSADLKNTPAFRAYMSSDQSVSNATLTTVQFNTLNFDTDSYFNTSNYRFTPLIAGKYFFGASQRYTSTANYDTDIDLEIRKNGSGVVRFRTPNYFQDHRVVTTILDMNGSTDYVEVTVYQTSGTTLSIQSGNSDSSFYGYKLIGA